MAWKGAPLAGFLEQLQAAGLEKWDEPMGGRIGTDGDCIAVCGMQNDSASGGAREIPGMEAVGTLIGWMLAYLETKLEAKWCVVVARDYIPSDHMVFHSVAGRVGLPRYAVAGSPGSKLHWSLQHPASHLYNVSAKRFIFGFKSYHEQIPSRSIFEYSAEVYQTLHDQQLDPVGHCKHKSTSKYAKHTGCVAAACPAMGFPAGPRLNDLSAPPPLAMLLPPSAGIAEVGAALPAAINGYFEAVGGKKQVRRLFLVGAPFDQDVAESALVAKMRRLILDVYIVVDATRPVATGDLGARLKALIPLLVKHGVRFCTFEQLVVGRPRAAVCTPVLLPAMKVPVGQFGRRPKEGSELEVGHVLTINPSDDNLFAKLFFADPYGAPQALSADALRRLVVGAPPHDRTYPQSARPAEKGKCVRLGQCLLKWAGRDVGKSSHWRYQTPSIELTSVFPKALKDLNFTLDAAHFPECPQAQGDGLFLLTLEDALECQESLTYVTLEGVMPAVRHVLQGFLRPHFVPYLAMRMDVPLRVLMAHDGGATQYAVDAAEKACEEADGEEAPLDAAEREWNANRLSEQTGAWTIEVEVASNLQKAYERVRAGLVDFQLRNALDDAMGYTLTELATMGVSRQSGYLTTRGAALEPCRGKLVFIQAAAVDFADARERRGYFNTDGEWLDGAQARFKHRMSHLWRCVLAGYYQAGVVNLSLGPLGAREVDLAPVPAARRGEVRLAAYQALFALLEEDWGFAQTFVQVEPQHYGLVLNEVSEGYALSHSVVVHVRDGKELCHDLAAEAGGAELVGYLILADAAALMLGQAGGRWELAPPLTPAHRHGYAAQEEAANTSTILLNHLGLRQQRLQGERVETQPADVTLASLLGPARGLGDAGAAAGGS